MDEIKLLLVEDDNSFRKITKDSLELTGRYEVFGAANGSEGYNAYKSFKPDIIVTDLDMPVMSGFEMIEKIKNEDKDIPIIITSGLTEPRDIAKGYDLGADNYIKKNFLPAELDLNIKAIFRRIERTIQINREENKFYSLGFYTFDLQNHCLTRGDIITKLAPLATQILQMLCEAKGNVVKRTDILNQFWGNQDEYFASRSLDVFIAKLRKCLNDDKSVEIVTVKGDGLKLVIR